MMQTPEPVGEGVTERVSGEQLREHSKYGAGEAELGPQGCLLLLDLVTSEVGC